jgi:hypothetical protein
MQLGEFFVDTPHIGVGRRFGHFAAMLLALPMIIHLLERHSG